MENIVAVGLTLNVRTATPDSSRSIVFDGDDVI